MGNEEKKKLKQDIMLEMKSFFFEIYRSSELAGETPDRLKLYMCM